MPHLLGMAPEQLQQQNQQNAQGIQDLKSDVRQLEQQNANLTMALVGAMENNRPLPQMAALSVQPVIMARPYQPAAQQVNIGSITNFGNGGVKV